MQTTESLNSVIKAPWSAPEGDKIDTSLDLMKFAHKQLMYYKGKNKIITQHLLDDITGYEQIIETNDENLAQYFLVLKNKMRGDEKLSELTNLQIVEYIKEKGKWPTK